MGCAQCPQHSLCCIFSHWVTSSEWTALFKIQFHVCTIGVIAAPTSEVCCGELVEGWMKLVESVLFRSSLEAGTRDKIQRSSVWGGHFWALQWSTKEGVMNQRLAEQGQYLGRNQKDNQGRKKGRWYRFCEQRGLCIEKSHSCWRAQRNSLWWGKKCKLSLDQGLTNYCLLRAILPTACFYTAWELEMV